MAKQNPPVWEVDKSAPMNAARKLPQLASRYFATGRELVKRSASEGLHQLRLETKQFRYTLELFRPYYGPGLDQRLTSLRKIQDLLSEIHDSVTMQNFLGRKQKPLAQFLQRRTVRKRRELNRYWQRFFDAAGQERWWSNYLARFAKKG